MDIYCSKCGEPWDHDELHEIASYNDVTYAETARDFRRNGCAALGGTCNKVPNEQVAMMATAASELLGDDMDGIAAVMDDMIYMNGGE